ncbi:MAG: hypothetical protein LBK94_13400 [Prevotellaceae bacterium]|jgi:hypothetical protein|nr:hypothetical protein [Prevotellaceae bacterium]
MTVAEFLNRLEIFDIRESAFEVLKEHEDDLIEIQKNQLWAGKDARGNDLTPSILDDPYFIERYQDKATAKAHEYAEYKDRQDQRVDNYIFGSRTFGVPNLILTSGVKVWRKLRVIYGDNAIYIDAGGENGYPDLTDELEAKYDEPFGVNPVGISYLRELFLDVEIHQKNMQKLFEV